MKRIVFYCLAIFLIAVFLAIVGPFFPDIWLLHESAFKVKCNSELSCLGTALNGYQTTYANYPTGNQAEVIKHLLGDNPQKIQFLNVSINDLSSSGEWLDPWKTPYAISFPSKNGFIVSSAGKDKIFGDSDDIIFNSVSNDFVKP